MQLMREEEEQMQHKSLVLLRTLVLFSLLVVHTGAARAQKASPYDLASTSTACQLIAGQVLINEVLPSPSNNGLEWVELYNTTASTIDLGSCVLDDIPGASPAYQIPPSTFIAPRGYWTVDQTSYFNNGGDTVRFLKENSSTLLDSYTYGNTGYNVSWYRLPDGGSWAASPTASTTRGQPNSIPFYPIVTAIHLTDPNPTSASNVRFSIVFSKDVTGVDTSPPFSDFALYTSGVTGAHVTTVSGIGSTYSVAVNTGTGNGTIRLDLVDNDSIRDSGNHPLGGTGAGNGSFTAGGVYTVMRRVTIAGNTGVAGVTMNYTGGSTMTNSNGYYTFDVLSGWSGTVTPSHANYLFSPSSRTYSNLTSNRWYENYTAAHSISGNAGIGGVTLSYIDGVARTVTSQGNGNYSLNVPSNWNGLVTPSHPCYTFTPGNRNYSGVTGNLTAEDYTASFNTGAGCAEIEAVIGGIPQGKFGLVSGAGTRASFPGVNNGPVKIASTNGIPLLAAERLIYKASGVATSFTEMMGLPDSQLDNIYWLPWYNNVDLDTQLRIGNVSGASATVHIWIGTTEVTPVGGISLPAGGSTRLSYAGINNGPVKITSDQDIVAAERLIYKANGKNTSFTEMMALPNSQLDNTYWLPWYNNVDLDTQLRFANVSEQTATVHVLIGGAEMPNSPFSLPPGASTRQSFAGINNGPVKIVSNVPVVAAERLIYKVAGVNTSFTEMMALPNSQLNNTYWLPWYNNADLDTQLRFANVHDTQTAQVHVYIGGVEVPNSPFSLLPGASTRQSFAGINNGPVQIVSNVPIVAAERLIYKIGGLNTSFSEMMALPNSALDTIYWLPWYNNLDLDTQLRFGVP
jgi:hypothetical protein